MCLGKGAGCGGRCLKAISPEGSVLLHEEKVKCLGNVDL